ncbi:unnamed protein product [Ixodes pacificus]
MPLQKPLSHAGQSGHATTAVMEHSDIFLLQVFFISLHIWSWCLNITVVLENCGLHPQSQQCTAKCEYAVPCNELWCSPSRMFRHLRSPRYPGHQIKTKNIKRYIFVFIGALNILKCFLYVQ